MFELCIQKQLASFSLDVRLQAPEEKVVVLFGPSGAGKSLTLSAVAGLMTPDAGRIAVGGHVLFDARRAVNLRPQQRQIGLVRQDLALFPHLTVRENIAYGLYHTRRADASRQVGQFLELMQLTGLGERRPGELSGGQQQRVALARALAIRPAVLLLDEPFSALDQSIRIELRNELKALQARLGTTMLFITHDLGEAYLLADYLAVIDQGRILQFDTPQRVFDTPQSLRVAQTVGVKNILAATVLSPTSIRVGEMDLEAPVGEFKPGSRVYACVRPERITLVRQERRGPPLHNLMEGDLIQEQSDGANYSLSFRIGGARLMPDQPSDLQIDIPVYMYERLNLSTEKHWSIAIKPGEIHLVST